MEITLELKDGRDTLYQWDTDRKLQIEPPDAADQLHFSTRLTGQAVGVPVENGVARIPDEFLQATKDLHVFAFEGTPESGYTAYSTTFQIVKRPKPADYMFTPTDQLTLEEIKQMVEDLRDDVANGDFGGVKDYNELDNRPLRPFPVTLRDDGRYAVNLDDLDDNTWYYPLLDQHRYTVIYFSRANIFGGKKHIVRDLNAMPLAYPCLKYSTKSIIAGQVKEQIRIEDGVSTCGASLSYYTDPANSYTNVSVHANIPGAGDLLVSWSNQTPQYPTGPYSPVTKDYVDTAIISSEDALAAKFGLSSSWLENNPASARYIVGRTHYEYVDPSTATNTLEWDGVIGDRPATLLDPDGEIYLVKVSDYACSADDLIGGTVTVTNGEESMSSPVAADSVEAEGPLVLVYDALILSCSEDLSVSELSLQIGTYVMFQGGVMYVSKIQCTSAVFGETVAVPLDAKYIPATIARTKDIPTDDHINELINTALGVIENGTY